MLSFILQDIKGKKITINDVENYELLTSIDAPCDGLRINFMVDNPIDEIQKVLAYNGKKLVFNGYCDTQRESYNSSGHSIFIYARSSACLLIDNQADPFTYQNPSSMALYFKNAKQFGFKYNLPDIYCNEPYQVSNGTSCYGAINNFVNGICGKNIIIDAENTIKMPNSNNTVNLSDYNISNITKIINRGDALSQIDYKISSDEGYVYHKKSMFCQNKNIHSNKIVNVSSLPQWQRDYIVSNKLKNSCENYDVLQVTLCDDKYFNLYDKVILNNKIFGMLDDYYICEMINSFSKNGYNTKLIMRKNIEIGEVMYVAK